MKVLILGGDGYLGWPTAMHFAKKDYEVMVVDNYLKRGLTVQTDSEPLFHNLNLERRAQKFEELSGKKIQVNIGDCADINFMKEVFTNFTPDTVIHYAEQPSAPYSMKGFSEANLTLNNNLQSTFNLIWCVKDICPDAHIVKLGTMGEYGAPNIDIEEGWLDVEHKGRNQKFLYPRQAGSLYHTTKVLDTDLLWFYVRAHGLRVTDLMQGPVYGLETEETNLSDDLLPSFHYDDIFGTLINRFLVQAVTGVPLTVYGKGGQVRGYLNLKDTLACVELAANTPVDKGELRILNQFTETFSVNDLADRVIRVGNKMGLNVVAKNIPNPRKEPEDHYYNPSNKGFKDLGLEAHLLTDEVIESMLNKIITYKDRIDSTKILPRVSWNK